MTLVDLHREKAEPPGKRSARLVGRPPLAVPAPAHLAGTRWQPVATRPRRPSEDLAPLDRICLHDGEDVVLVPARAILVARSDDGVTTVDLDGQALRTKRPGPSSGCGSTEMSRTCPGRGRVKGYTEDQHISAEGLHEARWENALCGVLRCAFSVQFFSYIPFPRELRSPSARGYCSNGL